MLATALVAMWAGAACAGSARAAAPEPPVRHELVVLMDDRVARSKPGRGAHRIGTISGRRPLTGVRTVLPVLEVARDGGGRRWLHVRLPGRPNGHKGWIPASHTRRASTAWHIAVELSTRRVSVFHHGRPKRRFRAVVGTSATPTPRGRFFVEEAVRLAAGDAGGPYALALSARSTVLQEFDGGPGQIAVHGTDGLAGAPGVAASHGCIRLSPRAITWLARRVGRGTPVSVTG